MSKKNSNIVAIVCWIIVGLVIGYLIFGKVNGNMISLKTLCLPAENGIKKLASKAADLGSDDAMLMLGKMSLSGEGMVPSRRNAEKWLKKAAGRGNAEAAEMLDRMRSEDI